MILYHLSSGSGGMADALDSGSSGSLSCESSSLFFRIAKRVEKSLYIKVLRSFFCRNYDLILVTPGYLRHIVRLLKLNYIFYHYLVLKLL